MGTSGYQNHQRSSTVSCFLIIGISVISAVLFIKLWSMSAELNQIRDGQELLQDSFNDKTKKLLQSLLTATQLKQENDRVKQSLEDLQSQKDQCAKNLKDRQVEVDNEKMKVANVQEELIITQENATSYLQQLSAELRKKSAEYATLTTIKKALMDSLNETQTELKRCNSKVSTMQCPPCPEVPQAPQGVVGPSEPQPAHGGAVPSVPMAAPITAGNETANVEGPAATTAEIAAPKADLSPAQRETPQEINPESGVKPVVQAGDTAAGLGNESKLDSARNDPDLKPEVTEAQAPVLNASWNDAAAVEAGAKSSAVKQKRIDDAPAQIPLPLNEESQRNRAEAAAEAGDLQAQMRWLETNTSISNSSSIANTIINSNNTSLNTTVIGGRNVSMFNVTTISNASSLHRPTLQEVPSQAVPLSDTQGNVEGGVAANPAPAEAAASVADNESIEQQRPEPAHLEPQADAAAKVDANVEKLDKPAETGLDGDLQQPATVIGGGDNISENAAAKIETGDMQNIEPVEPKPDAIAQDDDQDALSPRELVQPVPAPQEPMLEAPTSLEDDGNE